MNSFPTGSLVRISATFTDYAGNNLDPSTVLVTITDPSGATTQIQYGLDPDLVREEVGVYHYDLDLSKPGRWCFAWKSTGTGQAAQSGQLFASPITC